MLSIKILALGLILLGLNSYAGTDRGNGGYAVVCRDNSGPIVSAELLDIYEGKLLHKRSYPETNDSVDNLIAAALKKTSFHSAFYEKVLKEITKINQNIVFIPEGHELSPTEDAFPAVRKKGCEFEQLANYTDAGEVIISQEIYDHLDNLNRAALIIHEAIYTIRRKSLGETTSQNSRRLVAQIMASSGDVEMINRLVNDSLYRPNQRKRPCGLSGTIEERIDACSYLERNQYNMILVTRTQELKEVWYDLETKLLWSDRLSATMSHSSAEQACRDSRVSEMGYFTELKWRLPSEADYAQKAQILFYALPNMSSLNSTYWFWTSTERGRSVITYNGADGTFASTPFKNSRSGSTRCVSSY